MWHAPAVAMRRSPLGNGFDEDAQLFQAHVGPSAHPDDADAQAVLVWESR